MGALSVRCTRTVAPPRRIRVPSRLVATIEVRNADGSWSQCGGKGTSVQTLRARHTYTVSGVDPFCSAGTYRTRATLITWNGHATAVSAPTQACAPSACQATVQKPALASGQIVATAVVTCDIAQRGLAVDVQLQVQNSGAWQKFGERQSVFDAGKA